MVKKRFQNGMRWYNIPDRGRPRTQTGYCSQTATAIHRSRTHRLRTNTGQLMFLPFDSTCAVACPKRWRSSSREVWSWMSTLRGLPCISNSLRPAVIHIVLLRPTPERDSGVESTVHAVGKFMPSNHPLHAKGTRDRGPAAEFISERY